MAVASARALIIGGSGPTGPHLINGLIERGYDVTMMHRGTHDSPLIPSSVERIIGDPHFRETLAETLGDRSFDLVIATYGRIRYIAEEMVGRTPRFIAIGGPPCYRGMFATDALDPPGMIIPTPEDAPRVESEEEFRFGYLIRLTEDAVFDTHSQGHYNATMFRYPVVYGTGQLGASVWAVMERALDGRQHIVLPDGGMAVVTRGYAPNVAHAVLLAVDHPDRSAGRTYNCGDEQQLTLSQWVSVICDAMDHRMEVIGVPAEVAFSTRDFLPLQSAPVHQLLDLHAIRAELGYRDLVPALEAIPEVVQWYLANRPPSRRTLEERAAGLNYAAEDEQVALYRQFHRRLAEVEHVTHDVHHPYPHPRQPGLVRDHRRR
ncbi:MAG: NAD-dependent epimerase/dehydratase family protein [Actinomycetia bacterium]|nr:NAD-dependent epimerase/dehydratase family protein [Actinomycetes bacterium]MCP4225151.1 NAD-dependent epimerase/dehydratase family protein [Actinomycetes bacterium]MCP5033786.1 NAD-dependent epimerase/dehydratase family protein [Actinomycetes bacterium]